MALSLSSNAQEQPFTVETAFDSVRGVLMVDIQREDSEKRNVFDKILVYEDGEFQFEEDIHSKNHLDHIQTGMAYQADPGDEIRIKVRYDNGKFFEQAIRLEDLTVKVPEQSRRSILIGDDDTETEGNFLKQPVLERLTTEKDRKFGYTPKKREEFGYPLDSSVTDKRRYGYGLEENEGYNKAYILKEQINQSAYGYESEGVDYGQKGYGYSEYGYEGDAKPFGRQNYDPSEE